MFYNDGNIFFTTYFNVFDIIELFFLNSGSNSLHEILSIRVFLVDSSVDSLYNSLMFLCISFIALKILKFSLPGPILINLKSGSFSIVFRLSISWLMPLSL